jgi:hypothetical protein
MKASPWLFLLASAALAAPQEPATTKREAAGAGKARDVVRLPGGPPRPAGGEGAEEKWDRPEVQPPDTSRKLVKAPSRPETAAPTAASAAGAPGGVRLVRMSPGEALVVVGGAEQSLREGDRLGSDVVRAVGDGVIVLDRPAVPGQPGGEAIVVMRFDASGQPTVRVYHAEDPTPVNAPEVQ